MSAGNTNYESENVNYRTRRPRLWNPNAKDENDQERLQTLKVSVAQPPIANSDIYLPENRPQIVISNAIQPDDLPQCRPKSECQDTHPADCVHVTDTDSFNQRQNILHDKWNNHDIKVFTDKYQHLESNKDKKFDLIAKALPNKTSADCREFYYMYKHILSFKEPERVRKQKIKEKKKSLLQLKEPCTSRLRSGSVPSDIFCVKTTPTKKRTSSDSSTNKRPVVVSHSATLLTNLQKTEKCATANTSPNLDLTNLFLLADVCIKLPKIECKPNVHTSTLFTQQCTDRQQSVQGKPLDECIVDDKSSNRKSSLKRRRPREENVLDATRNGRAIKRPKRMNL